MAPSKTRSSSNNTKSQSKKSAGESDLQDSDDDGIRSSTRLKKRKDAENPDDNSNNNKQEGFKKLRKTRQSKEPAVSSSSKKAQEDNLEREEEQEDGEQEEPNSSNVPRKRRVSATPPGAAELPSREKVQKRKDPTSGKMKAPSKPAAGQPECIDLSEDVVICLDDSDDDADDGANPESSSPVVTNTSKNTASGGRAPRNSTDNRGGGTMDNRGGSTMDNRGGSTTTNMRQEPAQNRNAETRPSASASQVAARNTDNNTTTTTGASKPLNAALRTGWGSKPHKFFNPPSNSLKPPSKSMPDSTVNSRMMSETANGGTASLSSATENGSLARMPSAAEDSGVARMPSPREDRGLDKSFESRVTTFVRTGRTGWGSLIPVVKRDKKAPEKGEPLWLFHWSLKNSVTPPAQGPSSSHHVGSTEPAQIMRQDPISNGRAAAPERQLDSRASQNHGRGPGWAGERHDNTNFSARASSGSRGRDVQSSEPTASFNSGLARLPTRNPSAERRDWHEQQGWDRRAGRERPAYEQDQRRQRSQEGNHIRGQDPQRSQYSASYPDQSSNRSDQWEDRGRSASNSDQWDQRRGQDRWPSQDRPQSLERQSYGQEQYNQGRSSFSDQRDSRYNPDRSSSQSDTRDRRYNQDQQQYRPQGASFERGRNDRSRSRNRNEERNYYGPL